jgi:hypothetical protein
MRVCVETNSETRDGATGEEEIHDLACIYNSRNRDRGIKGGKNWRIAFEADAQYHPTIPTIPDKVNYGKCNHHTPGGSNPMVAVNRLPIRLRRSYDTWP